MKKIALIFVLLVLSGSMVMGASSQQNRNERGYLVGYSPFGIHIPTLIAPPITLGVYLSEDFLVGFEYGSVDFETEDSSTEKFEGSFVSQGIYTRWFPGTNSFNLLLAIHKRTFDMNFNFLVDDYYNGTQIPVSAHLKADAIVATLGFSNQWMMDFGLVLGMDWLLLSGLVSSSSEGDIDTTSALISGSQEEADAEKELEEGGEFLNFISGLPGLLVFSIGYAF